MRWSQQPTAFIMLVLVVCLVPQIQLYVSSWVLHHQKREREKEMGGGRNNMRRAKDKLNDKLVFVTK